MTGCRGNNRGFTLIELISIIVLLGILAVVATAKWPGDMQEEAAAMELKRAIRYAQHQAMTRAFTNANDAWGLVVTGANSYSIRRRLTVTDNAPDFTNRSLLDDTSITININPPGTDLWFNGLGEPIDSGGNPLATVVIYTIAGTENLTVCPQTGFVAEGNACP